MTYVRRVAVVALVAIAAFTPAMPAAAATGPQPGACYMLTTPVLESMTWPASAARVPCEQPHTFEVTRTGSLRQDVNARYYAQMQCPDSAIWSDVGVNQPVNGLIRNPVRVEGYWFVAGGDRFVCGAAIRSLHGTRPATSEPLASAVSDLDEAQLAALRFCSKAANGRDVAKPSITVDCATVPRWEVTQWIDWSDFYADFPGTAPLRARAKELCPAGARFSYPDAARWAAGDPRTWCYLLIK